LFELGGSVVFGEPALQTTDVRVVAKVQVLIGIGDVGAALVEGLFGRPGLRTEQAGFQQQVPEQEAGESPVGLDGPLVVEPPRDEGGEEFLDDPQAAQRWAQPRRGGMSGRDQREDLGVIAGQRPDAVGEPLQIGLPALGRGEQCIVRTQVQLGDHPVDDALEQVFPSVDVAVERHRLDVELVAQPAHRQSGEPALVDEVDGRADDPLAGQARPRHVRDGRVRAIGVAVHARPLSVVRRCDGPVDLTRRTASGSASSGWTLARRGSTYVVRQLTR